MKEKFNNNFHIRILVSFIMVILFICLSKFLFDKNKETKPISSPSSARDLKLKKQPIEAESILQKGIEIKVEKQENVDVKKNKRRLSKTIEKFNEFSAVELELLVETSKLKIDRNIVNQFIWELRKQKNRGNLLKSAAKISDKNLGLYMVFVKHINQKYPLPEIKEQKQTGIPVSSQLIFNNLKKGRTK